MDIKSTERICRMSPLIAWPSDRSAGAEPAIRHSRMREDWLFLDRYKAGRMPGDDDWADPIPKKVKASWHRRAA